MVTSGGRVLCVTALGDTVAQARQRAYQAVQGIGWDDAYHRRTSATVQWPGKGLAYPLRITNEKTPGEP